MFKKIACTAVCFFGFQTLAQPFHTDEVLEKSVPMLMKKHGVPGVAIGILEEGTVAKYYFVGHADLSLKKPIDENTGFNLGSISKSVTAWGVMKLVEQGKVDLDKSIQQYVKRWKIPASTHDVSGVTVRRLLSHTSGLSQHAVPQFELDEPIPSLEKSLSENANFDGEYLRLVNPPGLKWSYSGGGYALLQLLIEEVTGELFSDYMFKEILEPLGMLDSHFEPDEKLLSQSAKPYDHHGKETPRVKFAAIAAAGLQSTPVDLAKFANAALTINDELIAGRGVLKPETLSLMTSASSSAKLADGSLAHRNYGLGYFVTSDKPIFFGHGGDNRGWHSRFILYPETNNGMVILTNSSNGFLMAESINCLLANHLASGNEPNCI